MSKSFRVRAGWPARQRGGLAAACGLIGLALLPAFPLLFDNRRSSVVL